MREDAAPVLGVELVQILFCSRAEMVRDVPPVVPIPKLRFFSHRPPPMKARFAASMRYVTSVLKTQAPPRLKKVWTIEVA